MAAELIYTYSCGSICCCHVCTTRAVCLYVLAFLWSLCRDIGLFPRAGDICFAEIISDVFFWFNEKKTFFLAPLRIKWDKCKRKIWKKKKKPKRFCSVSFGHEMFAHLKWGKSFPFSLWLFIGSVFPAAAATCERKQKGTVDQYFSSSAEWHGAADVIDVPNDNCSLFGNTPFAKWHLVKLNSNKWAYLSLARILIYGTIW